MNEMAEIGLYLALFMTIMVILIGVNLYRYTKERRFKNKASYMLRMIDTSLDYYANCQIFYSNRSTGGENEIIKFISKEDTKKLKKYNAISKYFKDGIIFMLFSVFWMVILFHIACSDILFSSEIHLIFCLLLADILLCYFNFVHKNSFCNDILANEVSKFIFDRLKIKSSTK